MSHLKKTKPDITANMTETDIPKLADDLNQFYLRFERPADPVMDQPQADITEANLFSEDDINADLQKCAPGKASGPNGVATRVLKSCAGELSGAMHQIFNRCVAAVITSNYGDIQKWCQSKKTPDPSHLTTTALLL